MALREAMYRWCCCRKVPENTDRKASFIVRQKGSEVVSNISNAVTVSNGQVTTSSLKIAEVFGKKHCDVLRAIESLQVPDDFRKRTFAFSEYSAQNGIGKIVKYTMVVITRDGFTILVMGFTGAKAMQFKIAYLEEFNRMEAKLRELSAVPVQPELPLDSAPVPAGRFSALKYQGVEVIPADELRRRLGITRGQLGNWLHVHRPLVDGVDVFRISGVPDKLAFAMIKAGYPVNPNIISVNLYTRSGFAKAAARFVTVEPVSAPEPVPAPVPMLDIPLRDPKAPLREYHVTVSKEFLCDYSVTNLLAKLHKAGSDVEKEMIQAHFVRDLAWRFFPELTSEDRAALRELLAELQSEALTEEDRRAFEELREEALRMIRQQ